MLHPIRASTGCLGLAGRGSSLLGDCRLHRRGRASDSLVYTHSIPYVNYGSPTRPLNVRTTAISVFIPLNGPAPAIVETYLRKAEEYSASRRVSRDGRRRNEESSRPSRLARSPDWCILYISVSFGVKEIFSRISLRTLRRRVSSMRFWITTCL